MTIAASDLYQLLPEVYRLRDQDQGGPLEALMGILGEQAALIQNELDRLYDNQFIETCEDWAVPYIGALVGYRVLHDLDGISQRAAVANQIRLVRRKGTALVLEQLATDSTGWPAGVVEFFQRLARPEHLAALRPESHHTLDFRNVRREEHLGTAFDTASYSVDTGRIAVGEGLHNIRNIGIYLWRLTAYPQPRSPAFRHAARRFFFNSLGFDTPLFNLPLSEETVTHLAEPANVPHPLERRLLDLDLADYYGRAFVLFIDGISVPVSDVHVCDLRDDGPGWAHTPSDQISVDPVLGRIATPQGAPDPETVEVIYHYGFSADMGGGAYPRSAGFATELEPVRSVGAGEAIQPTLDLSQPGGVVEIASSDRYEETLSIQLDPDRGLELRAADGQRPSLVLAGDFEIAAGAEAEVTIDGLTIAGGRLVVPDSGDNALRRLTLRHVTLVPGILLETDRTPLQPGTASLVIEAPNVTVEVERSIMGSIQAVASTSLEITDSIVDATDRTLPAVSDLDGESHAGHLCLRESTVVGKVAARSFPLISNSIIEAALAEGDSWTAPLWAERRQTGCARFSYIPPGSRAPRRHRCQPDFAVQKAIEAAELANPLLGEPARMRIARGVQARVVPGFTDRRYGKPGYLQLLTAAPVEIREGASTESEMGTFHHLFQPQRASNLRFRLEEFLGTGLEAGLIYVT